ncbi:MAG: MOSC domain-containing protein, partial [Microthrixaceae bacterium]
MSTLGAAELSQLTRMSLPRAGAEYDLRDSEGTVRSVGRRWRWTIEGLDDVPHAALVAHDAMLDVLQAAGGVGDDLPTATHAVEAELDRLCGVHGDRAKLHDALGEHHPLTIAVEECDRLLSVAARVVSQQVAQPAEGTLAGIFRSDGGAPKAAVDEIDIAARGPVGDRQADRAHHGRPFQAVCVYSLDVIEALVAEGHPITPGAAGENLTLAGVPWA